MNIRIRDGGEIESTSSGLTGHDGVNRILKSSVGSNGVAMELKGAGELASSVTSPEGSSVTYAESGVVQSTFDNGSPHSSQVAINTEGFIDTQDLTLCEAGSVALD